MKKTDSNVRCSGVDYTPTGRTGHRFRKPLYMLMLLLFTVTAAFSQNQRVSITADDITFEQFLDQVKTGTGLSYSLESTNIDMAARVTARYSDERVSTVLNAVLGRFQLTYEIRDNHILIYRGAPPASTATADGHPVTGQVIDAQGQPVIGVTVMVEGTTRGTTTGADGSFSIVAPSGESRLNISFIGYEAVNVNIGGRTRVDVVMKESVVNVDELVVVGYGTQIRRNVATAISSVSGDKLADLPVQNATEALVGRVPGLQLQQQSGAPGEAPVVRIRGHGSITSGNGPLYVIDGYPTNDATLFNAISPADIESIDVMKDAASAAIYGSRAGNGVILVTTKRGNKQDKTTFNFDMRVGFDRIMHKYPVMNAHEFVEMAIEGMEYNKMTVPKYLLDESLWTVTDWQDVIFRNGLYQDYHMSAMGGSDKVQYAVSGGYTDHNGILKNTYNKRYNFRISIDAQLTRNLKVGATLQPSLTKRRIQQTSGGNTSSGVDGILAEALTMPPILPVWRDNGDYFIIFQDPEMSSIFNQELSNPLNKLDGVSDVFNTFRQTGTFYIEYEPVKNLRLRSSLNMGYVNEREEYYTEAFIAKGAGNTGNISTPNLANIRARRRNQTAANLYWSSTATYDLELNQGHNFTFLAGYDAARQDDFYTQVEPRTDADNPVAFTSTAIKNVQGAVITKGESQRRTYIFDALFGRVNYNYKGRYLLSASIRRDRSSRFGPDNRAGYFPSVSAGWNVSDEAFMSTQNLFSTLKLRASYGETGNDQLSGYYSWLTTMSSSYYNFGTTDASIVGYQPGGFSNPRLGWEKNRQFDVGLDFGLFNNRLTVMVDYYNRRSNTILETDIPTINGKATKMMVNAGEIENKGVEFGISSVNFSGRFSWRTDLNISRNRNKILSLNAGQEALSLSGVIRNYVGRPFGDIYMYIVEGTFNTQEDLNTYALMGSQGIGDLRFKDVSGPDGVPDGVINSYDQVRVGNYQPKFTFGFNNSFSFKSFDLGIMMDGQVGGKVYRSQELALSLSRWLENGSKESIGRWRSPDNPGNGRYHRAGTTNLSSNISANTRYLYNADFLRITNITLGYTLPQRIAEKFSVQNLRVYVTTQNLHIFSNIGGFNNPQASTTGDSSTNNGTDAGAYPLARNISFGLNLTF